MNAKEARELTIEAAQNGETATAWLGAIHKKIEAAAKAGKTEIAYPFYGVRMPLPTTAQTDAIWLALQNDGYKVIHHPNPDPGHPASSEYTTIEW